MEKRAAAALQKQSQAFKEHVCRFLIDTCYPSEHLMVLYLEQTQEAK